MTDSNGWLNLSCLVVSFIAEMAKDIRECATSCMKPTGKRPVCDHRPAKIYLVCLTTNPNTTSGTLWKLDQETITKPCAPGGSSPTCPASVPHKSVSVVFSSFFGKLGSCSRHLQRERRHPPGTIRSEASTLFYRHSFPADWVLSQLPILPCYAFREWHAKAGKAPKYSGI